MHFSDAPFWPVESFTPVLPPGDIRYIYLHWSAGDYTTVYSAYHYCVALDGRSAVVAQTNDLRSNMRDVSTGGEYAAHTARRNSYAAGIAVMAMENARPDDFGPWPLTPAGVQALCRVAAVIAQRYAIPIDNDHVLTHAEAAIEDGYFGADEDDQRWDIARLHPASEPLTPHDAKIAGDLLRQRIAAMPRAGL